MKRIISLGIILLFFLSGCSKTNVEEDNSREISKQEETKVNNSEIDEIRMSDRFKETRTAKHSNAKFPSIVNLSFLIEDVSYDSKKVGYSKGADGNNVEVWVFSKDEEVVHLLSIFGVSNSYLKENVDRGVDFQTMDETEIKNILKADFESKMANQTGVEIDVDYDEESGMIYIIESADLTRVSDVNDLFMSSVIIENVQETIKTLEDEGFLFEN